MRLHDRTSNATSTKVNGVFADLLPSMVHERSSVRPGARWTDGGPLGGPEERAKRKERAVNWTVVEGSTEDYDYKSLIN